MKYFFVVYLFIGIISIFGQESGNIAGKIIDANQVKVYQVLILY